MLLDLPRNVIRSVARVRLRAHTLRIETVTWTHYTSPTQWLVASVMLMMYRMSNTSFSTAPIHTRSLSKDLCFPFSSAGLNNVSAFLGQESNKLYFFLYALIGFYEQASSRTS